MANGTVGIDEPAVIDKLLDTESLTVAAQTVHRERVQVSGNTDVGIAAVVNAAPTTEYGLVVRPIPSGTQNVADGGGSLTVDGTVTAAAQPGVDIGDVTVNNAGGASAVNIQDGGNSITVDGPLTDAQLRATPVPIDAALVDRTFAAPTTATVGVASAQAVAANASRKGLHLRNTSTSGQRISLGFDANAAVLDSGVTLYVGDVFEMDDFDYTTGAVNAISSAASGRLSVQEMT